MWLVLCWVLTVLLLQARPTSVFVREAEVVHSYSKRERASAFSGCLSVLFVCPVRPTGPCTMLSLRIRLFVSKTPDGGDFGFWVHAFKILKVQTGRGKPKSQFQHNSCNETLNPPSGGLGFESTLRLHSSSLSHENALKLG